MTLEMTQQHLENRFGSYTNDRRVLMVRRRRLVRGSFSEPVEYRCQWEGFTTDSISVALVHAKWVHHDPGGVDDD